MYQLIHKTKKDKHGNPVPLTYNQGNKKNLVWRGETLAVASDMLQFIQRGWEYDIVEVPEKTITGGGG